MLSVSLQFAHYLPPLFEALWFGVCVWEKEWKKNYMHRVQHMLGNENTAGDKWYELTAGCNSQQGACVCVCERVRMHVCA